MRTIIVGYLLADPVFDADANQPNLERKAELLELTLERTFDINRRPSKEALQAIADRVRWLLAEAFLER